jgi:predicted ATPase
MALVMLGSIDQGVRMIEDGIHVYRALKTPPIFYPILLSMQASAYGIAARPQEGMPLINEALQLGAQVKGKVFAPELMGAVAELLVALNNSAEAEQLLQAALQISQELQTTMLELRAAMKLSRLWQQQGKTEQARNVLQNAYAKMTEGFEMPDLVQAQALLQELG